MSDNNDRLRILDEIGSTLASSPLLSSQSAVRRFADTCGTDLGRSMDSMPGDASPRDLIRSLVWECASRGPDLQSLCEQFHADGASKDLVYQLYTLAAEWELRRVISAQVRRRIRSLLRRPTLASPFRDLARRAMGDREPVLPEWCVGAWSTFLHLCDANWIGQISPASIFLLLVAEHVDPSLGGEIRAARRELDREWSTTVPEFIPLPPVEHERSGYLLFAIEHQGTRPDHYQVVTWIQWDATRWAPNRSPATVVPGADLRRKVEELVHTAESTWSPDTGNIAFDLEFFLPADMLNEPVDQYELDSAGPAPRPLAVKYRVAVRSLERLRRPDEQRVWFDRWSRAKNAATLEDQWIDNSAGRAPWWALESQISDQHHVVAVVPSSPPRDPGAEPGSGAGQLEWEIARRNGIPIMVWHRCDCSSQEFRDFLATLRQRSLADLRQSVHTTRLRAWESNDNHQHIGRHLTVLWDDPERVPPQ